MFLLSGDVLFNWFDLGKADGKNPITALPREILQACIFRFNP
jgi:hypothetical protein